MNCFQLMQYAIGLEAQGKTQAAIEAYRSAIVAPNPSGFGPALLNLHALFIKLGDRASALQALIDFMNSPVLPSTIGVVPKVEQEIQALRQQLNPQQPQAPAPAK